MRTRRQIIFQSGTLILILTGASVLAPRTGTSQGLYNQANLFSSADIHVDGEVKNSGKFENKGTIALTGDWESSGQYHGNGELHARGNAPQKISHHNQSIGKLVVDGWGTKYIKGSLRIDGELTLNQGVVEVSPDDALRMGDKAVASGGSADTYIDGALIVTGRGYKFFPIGKNGTYAPIEFLDIKGDRTEFSVEAFENAPLTSVENVLVRNGLYWERRDISGNFEGARVAIAYDRNQFDQPERIILLTGTTWEEPFDVINDLEHSAEADKISTLSPVSFPLIALGETSNKWKDADFYLSTALSPHAARTENRAVKLFGERLIPDHFHFQVFDRWGTLVYENVSLEKMAGNGWDGRTSGGSLLAGGAYPFRLTALDKAGRKFEKKGVITIVY
jgi:hypothetical protein